MSRRPDPRILEIKRRRAGTIAKSKRVMTMSRHLTLTRGVLADHLDGVGQYPCGGCLVSGERVHRHDPHTLAERLAAFLEPCGERLLAPAFDHVQQAGRPAFLPGRQVHDDGHIPTAERGVSPHVLVHADLLDPVALGATPCGGPLRLAAYLPHAPASAHGQVPLHQGTQPQSVQAEQHPSVERAKLNAKPHGILHFFFHTTNETARPLHTKIGRAG